MAIAHILIEPAISIIVLRGGVSVIIAPIPAKILPPITTPKAIKKFCIKLTKKIGISSLPIIKDMMMPIVL
jgi:hypothetical protein